MAEYRISRRIGRGGMAEVFLALQAGPGGFEKLVVVKRIFKHFCEDERFVQMFLDEARLAASIRHPHVVEILDIVKDDDGFFIVMEYLSGENLAYVFEELRDRDALMPADLVCRVGAAIAGGLHSAHISTEVDGSAHPIIHRDVTPSNLIVCWNGTVKIVDFGVAKAAVGEKQTRPGMLKGKVEYLAPEQVEDRPVTPRTDVFQLGVVLHEMLTGHRLFEAETDHKIMSAVLERPIPRPSALRPGLSPRLDDVVMAALERDPARRLASADELRRGLEEVIAESGGRAGQEALSEWMHETFPARFEDRREVERECVQQVREGRPSSEIPAVLAPFAPTAPVAFDVERTTSATVAERPSRRPLGRATPLRRRRRNVVLAAAAGGVIAAAALAWVWWPSGASSHEIATADRPTVARGGGVADSTRDTPPRRDRPNPIPAAAPAAATAAASDAGPPSFEVLLDVAPAHAEILYDGKLVARGHFAGVFPRDGKNHHLEIRAPGHRTHSIVFRDAPPPPRVVLEPVRDASRGKAPPDSDTTRPSVVESTGGKRDAETEGEGEQGGDHSSLPPTDNRNPWGK